MILLQKQREQFGDVWVVVIGCQDSQPARPLALNTPPAVSLYTNPLLALRKVSAAKGNFICFPWWTDIAEGGEVLAQLGFFSCFCLPYLVFMYI